MKKTTIALLYNIRHQYPDPNNPQSQLEIDYDEPPVIERMIFHLKKIGFKVIPIEANEKAYLSLYKNRNLIDLAFNYSMGLYGRYKYAHIPAMLEMLRIPFTGSSTFTQAMVLDKSKMKQMLISFGISTLPYQVFESVKDKLNSRLQFPLIVKPVAQGSSAGITEKSVTESEKDLQKQIKFIWDTFGQPALIEPFLAYREFSVAMLGNPPKILPIIEPNYSLIPKDYWPMDSIEVKWVLEDLAKVNYLVCPANINTELKKKIENICLRVWKALEIKDLCRIDLRADKKGDLFVLDVNSPPGLIPPEVSNSFFPMAARTAGIEYEELLQMIINSALKRYKNNF